LWSSSGGVGWLILEIFGLREKDDVRCVFLPGGATRINTEVLTIIFAQGALDMYFAIILVIVVMFVNKGGIHVTWKLVPLGGRDIPCSISHIPFIITDCRYATWARLGLYRG
jgi:hypothetical protein